MTCTKKATATSIPSQRTTSALEAVALGYFEAVGPVLAYVLVHTRIPKEARAAFPTRASPTLLVASAAPRGPRRRRELNGTAAAFSRCVCGRVFFHFNDEPAAFHFLINQRNAKRSYILSTSKVTSSWGVESPHPLEKFGLYKTP